MKKLTFIDSLIDNSFSAFLIIIVPIISRFIGQFLMTYQSNNLALRCIIWCFTPLMDINIFWGIIMLSAGFITLVYIGYLGKKLSGE